MKTWELIVVGILYCNVAYRFYEMGRPGMTIAFVAYAVSNIGFMLDALKA